MVASGDDSGDADELWGDDLMAAIMGRFWEWSRRRGGEGEGNLEVTGVRLMNEVWSADWRRYVYLGVQAGRVVECTSGRLVH
jgi:hypothetical protein